jgi:hypothetical protein
LLRLCTGAMLILKCFSSILCMLYVHINLPQICLFKPVRSCAIVEVQQRSSVIGWVINIILSWASPWFEKHVKPLVPAAFAVVSTHQHAPRRVVGYDLFSLCVIHKEGLCPSSWDINRMMMLMMRNLLFKLLYLLKITASRL